MQLTTTQSTFLNMIKQPCIEKSVEYNITPSVMAAVGIIISDWGTSKNFYNTRNVYLLRANKSWDGKCYSVDSGKTYDSIHECYESGSILYRVYTDHQNSVKDFISYIATSRRSENGPLRYESIFGCTDYIETINRLERARFMEFYHVSSEDIQKIIEEYNLFDFDEYLNHSINEEDNGMPKKKHINIYDPRNKIDTSEEEIINEENTESEEEIPMINNTEHMYRVRLDWDRRDTQIFASPNHNDALAEAKKHEGYKIYIDDDGELFEDPWIKEDEEDSEPDSDQILAESGIKRITHPIPGKTIELIRQPVYRQAFDAHPSMYLSGTFYFYDRTIVNGRAKITKNNSRNIDPKAIIGYINII